MENLLTSPKHLLVPEIEVLGALVDSLVAARQEHSVEAPLLEARYQISLALNEALHLSKTAVH